jgi:uncharacterized spore protein YtfJ
MENQMAQAAEYIERIVERLNVNAVFGEVQREGDVAIIPVAQIGTSFGFGYGSGEGPAEGEERTPPAAAAAAAAWAAPSRAASSRSRPKGSASSQPPTPCRSPWPAS